MNSAAMVNNQLTLRVLGTSVTLLELLRVRAEQELGIKIEYLLHSVEDAQRIAVMHPERYDLYDQWFHNIDFVWPARAIQPLEIKRLKYWDEVNALAKLGTLNEDGTLADGSVPSQRLYVQRDLSLSSQPIALACCHSPTTRTVSLTTLTACLQPCAVKKRVGAGCLTKR